MAGNAPDEKAGRQLIIKVPEKYNGMTVAGALRLLGLDIDLPCGGNGRCGKCSAVISVVDGGVRSEKTVKLCRETVQGEVTVYLPEKMILGRTSSESLQGGISGKNVISGAAEAFLAVDVGTTTVEAQLCSKDQTGSLLSFAALNPQKKYGADVISRIAFSQTGGGLERLTADIRNCINGMLRRCGEVFPGINVTDVYVAGNTTMQHLFLGVSPEGIGRHPFKPAFTETKRVKGSDIGIDAGCVTLLPSADAFIGADVVAGAACLIKDDEGPALFIDLGTNGEMVLKADGKYYATSSAAGPCFEGANISCGTGGIPGAISKVEKNGSVTKLGTIGQKPPVGICGAGLVSLISMLLRDDIIDETGLMEEDFMINGLLNSDDPGSFTETGLALTRKDVREFQLAKAAIRTGIEILLERAGIGAKDVRRVYTAGGLGSYIDKHDAVEAGIFPPEFEDKILASGNTSLRGAAAAGIDPEFMINAEKLASVIDSFSLNDDKNFNTRFVDNMYFE